MTKKKDDILEVHFTSIMELYNEALDDQDWILCDLLMIETQKLLSGYQFLFSLKNRS